MGLTVSTLASSSRSLLRANGGTMLVEPKEPESFFNPTGSKAVVCAFASPTLILTGHESGKVALFDAKNGDEVLNNERAHMDVVTDLQMSPDGTYFVTSSKDKTARVIAARCYPLRALTSSEFRSCTIRRPCR